MKALITGAGGFIGGWLARLLLGRGDEVIGVSRHAGGVSVAGGTAAAMRHIRADLCDPAAIASAVAEARPDCIFHLAASSHIPTSFDHPVETFTVNAIGTLHLIAAVRAQAPQAVLVSVGSSAEYGDSCRIHDAVEESDCLLPTSPYAVSKAAQGLACRQAFRSHGVKTVHVRPFQIIGPGKRKDALGQFAAQVARFERDPDAEATVHVGNLEPMRDFVDVRDCAAALALLADRGDPGEAYNVCSGRATQLAELVDVLRSVAKRPFEVAQDSKLLRPIDDLRIVGDPRKLAALGYVARYGLVDSVRDTVESFRTDAPG